MTVPNTKFHLNPSSGSRTDIWRRTDISKQLRVACPIIYNVVGSRDSVVSTAARLGAGRTRARIQAGSVNFSLLHNAQTGCGAHPAFYSVRVVVLSWRTRCGHVADHSSPSNDEVTNEWSYTSTPTGLHGVDWDNFTFSTWSDHSEGLRRHARWSHHSEGLRRHVGDHTTATDWEDTQMNTIRL